MLKIRMNQKSPVDLGGYTFKSSDLINLALRHRSVGKPDNERLEFLGDSLLGMIVAEWLFQQNPKFDEGQLTRMRARLVCGETLTILAKNLDLSCWVQLGPGEKKTGGSRRASILADAFEAVIAAIYLESGMDVTREWVVAQFLPIVDERLQERPLKDAKTRLQEWVQKRKLTLPQYTLLKSFGPDHNQTFVIECTMGAYRYQASASSRRKAEQLAAENILKMITESEL